MNWIIGADSLIGGALRDYYLHHRIPHLTTSRRLESTSIALDLSDSPEKWKLPGEFDGVVYFCAAQTGVRLCEENPSATSYINVTATVELSRILLERGAHVVFLSSNLVFDGTKPFYSPKDHCSPTTEYGRQKHRAESTLLQLSKNVTVVRLTKVVHPGMPLFCRWKSDLSDHKIIHPYLDVKFSPVLLDFTRDALVKIGDSRPGGIIHLSGDRDLSYADAALVLAQTLGVEENLIKPVESPSQNQKFGTLSMVDMPAVLALNASSALESLHTLFKSLP